MKARSTIFTDEAWELTPIHFSQGIIQMNTRRKGDGVCFLLQGVSLENSSGNSRVPEGKGEHLAERSRVFARRSALGRRRGQRSLRTCGGDLMELLKLVPSEKCNYYTCSSQMSEHCYKMRCNHRKDDCSAALLPQNSLCVLGSPEVLINLLGVLTFH